jgi:small GTP-binding protein
MEEEKKEKTIKLKIGIGGTTGVGKTQIINRIVNDEFEDIDIITMGFNSLNKTVIRDEKKIILEFWDTAGQERYFSMVEMYFRNLSAAIIVYDLSSRDSLGYVQKWLDKVKTTNENCVIILFGNKEDLLEKTPQIPDSIKELESKYQISESFTGSAKTGKNIDQLLDAVINGCNFGIKQKIAEVTPRKSKRC